MVGAFALALLPAAAAVRARPRVALLLGPGVLGGFTTLSEYAEESRALLADGSTGLAGAYLLAAGRCGRGGRRGAALPGRALVR